MLIANVAESLVLRAAAVHSRISALFKKTTAFEASRVQAAHVNRAASNLSSTFEARRAITSEQISPLTDSTLLPSLPLSLTSFSNDRTLYVNRIGGKCKVHPERVGVSSSLFRSFCLSSPSVSHLSSFSFPSILFSASSRQSGWLFVAPSLGTRLGFHSSSLLELIIFPSIMQAIASLLHGDLFLVFCFGLIHGHSLKGAFARVFKDPKQATLDILLPAFLGRLRSPEVVVHSTTWTRATQALSPVLLLMLTVLLISWVLMRVPKCF